MKEQRIQAMVQEITAASIAGQLGSVETCFILWPLILQTTRPIAPEDKALVGTVINETSHLPVGRLKDDWHPDFVGPKLAELYRYEIQIREDVQHLCERLQQQFATDMEKA
jgi:hypothetical protein